MDDRADKADEGEEARPKVTFVPSDHPLDNDKPKPGEKVDKETASASGGEARVKFTITGYATLKAEQYKHWGVADPKAASANDIARAEFAVLENDPWMIFEMTEFFEKLEVELAVVPTDSGK